MTRRGVLLGGAAAVVLGAAAMLGRRLTSPSAAREGDFPFRLSDEEWRQHLTPPQYRILREHGTEPAGTSPLNAEKRTGTYHCAGCDHPLYSSETKYESGTGWPSFWQPLDGAVGTSEDRSFFMVRTEIHCANCGGHLGHVFEDGPPPTGLRYCMNGLALAFRPAESAPPA
ncbi:MAG TPA: peptide-methionine (R)-S-oxide reductase MsrB [Afifellaceae bacterium]|nr:peptide-methionine (R)-S-oxide reductase MsrB [Afifellaceae bacterium]